MSCSVVPTSAPRWTKGQGRDAIPRYESVLLPVVSFGSLGAHQLGKHKMQHLCHGLSLTSILFVDSYSLKAKMLSMLTRHPLYLFLLLLVSACLSGAAPRWVPYFLSAFDLQHLPLEGNQYLDARLASQLQHIGFPSARVTPIHGSPIEDQALMHELRYSAEIPRFVLLREGALGHESAGLAMHVRPETIPEIPGTKTFAIMSLAPPDRNSPAGRHLPTFWHHHFVTVQNTPDLERRLSTQWQHERRTMSVMDYQILSAEELLPKLNQLTVRSRRPTRT